MVEIKKLQCNWPRCTSKVMQTYWACPKHWQLLPPQLKSPLWKSYKPGQPDSPAYTKAMEATSIWITEYYKKQQDPNDMFG